ncbi:beta-lactamase family protein [Myxococcus sp. K38C18041901]|uniref:serine hydrolase domain-containing protein n=1 Tax=Myxococcus guangdongensis TaxID=2906760 RepID=UPI0020A7C80B|nr:serine hydrolase [Myxococcus guangdongensis]MCP3057497.1 beta-lactamase family protein [Myxococcus guangdongensis]
MHSSSSLCLGAVLALLSLSPSVRAAEPAAPPKPPAQAPATDAAEKLVGIWSAAPVYGPEVQGELTVFREGTTWRARISGYEATGQVEKGALSLTLPGGQGTFRATVAADGQVLRGHWVQPRVMVGGVQYATPVELRSLQKGVWRGTVTPWADRFTLYLVVYKKPDGAIAAYLRDPEKGFGRQFALNVSVQGSAVKLVDPRGPTTFEGTLDERSGRLSVPIFFLGNLQFTRRERDQAVGLYPRTPAPGAYVYRPPVAEQDGWATASLSDVGMDPAPIQALMQRLLDTEVGPGPAQRVQGVLIARKGKLVLEEYFYGYDKEKLHDLRSASKTLAPVLVGTAIQKGAKLSAQTPVYSMFPGYQPKAPADARKAGLTLEHLMTMTSGFDCDDDNEETPGNENNLQSQEGDWYAYTLDLPMGRAPGETQAVYCSAGINLVGGVVRNATGTWLPEHFERTVATPLQFRHYAMNLMPDGEAYLGGGLYARPRDALKLGQLYLSGGVWNGRRVVSKQWVERSTARHSVMSPERTYGYAWWRHELRVGERVYAEYEAGGNGGQYVMVIPELELTVMFTGGNYGQFNLWKAFREELLPRYILAAVRR